jgi:hypothetical protein
VFSGPIWLRLLRWGVLVAAALFLYTHLDAEQGTAAMTALGSLGGDARVWVVLALVPVNWGLESAKWRLLMEPVQPLGRWRSFVATLAGTGIALVTPNRTGEFLGRVLYLDPEHRVAGGFATALGSIAQCVVTLVAGAVGLVVLAARSAPLPWSSGGATHVLAALALGVAGSGLVCYFHPGWVRRALLRVPILRRTGSATEVLERFRGDQLALVLGISALRYVVFTGQFVLLCLVLNTGLGAVDAALAVAVVYLITTLVPTMFISELGVRGSVALGVLVPLGSAPAAAVAASGLLWSCNVVLPAVVGSVLLLTVRIRTRS